MPLRLSVLFGLHDFVGLLCQTKRSLPCGFGNNGKLLSLILLLYCNRRISLAILTSSRRLMRVAVRVSWSTLVEPCGFRPPRRNMAFLPGYDKASDKKEPHDRR